MLLFLQATSKEIELAYLNNKTYFHFGTKENKYKISFDNMIQTNLNPNYGTVRNIRRRPVFKTLRFVSFSFTFKKFNKAEL